MCKLILSIILVSLSFSLAQNKTQASGPSQYVSVTAGLPLLSVQYGINALGDNGDLRFRVGITPIWGFAVNTGVDALFRVGDLEKSSVYAGAGIGTIYRRTDYNAENIWTLGGALTLGYERDINSNISLINETAIGLDYSLNASYGNGWQSPGIRILTGLKFKL